MLNRIDDLLRSKSDFAFETTLSSKSYVNTVKEAQKAGYYVTLVYFWLNSVDLAIERVQMRVREGGHNIPVDTIRRRYKLGIENLFDRYIPTVDYWLIFDNSMNPSNLIAEGNIANENKIYNESVWSDLKALSDG